MNRGTYYVQNHGTDSGCRGRGGCRLWGRIICKRGLIARHTEEIRLAKVETIEIRQSIFQRILGAGSVIATGTGASDVILKDVDSPLDVKRVIEDRLEMSI